MSAGAPAGRRWTRAALIATVVAYMGVLIIGPMVALVAGALQDGLPTLWKELQRPDLVAAFALTLKIALACVLFHLVAGTVVAWVLVRQSFRGRRAVSGLVDLPFAVSPVVVGYMLLLLFGHRGVLGPWLASAGIQVAFAVPGMLVATLFVTIPLMIRELMPALEALGTDQEQAAATLGAGGFTTFRRVVLPALRWGFVYGVVLTFARALGEFGAVLVVGGGIQGRTETTTLFIYRALEERQEVAGYGAALILGLISLGLVLGVDVLRRRDRRRA